MMVCVPAFADTIVNRNDNIAYSVGISKSSGRINFTGGVKKSSATEAFARIRGFLNGSEILEQGQIATNDAYVHDYVSAEEGYYEYEFYGYVNYGPNDAYQDYCLLNGHLSNVSTTLTNALKATKVNSYINRLGNSIIKSFGYDANKFYQINISDTNIPSQLINYYYKDLVIGLGSSKPVIFTDGNEYLIAFQDKSGVNIVKDITIPTAGDMRIMNKSKKSVKASFK
ncbi:hypothetical protein A7X67_01195 [Clostridium sp. W14A]|nr:hypothetical protein A7X67_01195 [Clostridium sp. W14A]